MSQLRRRCAVLLAAFALGAAALAPTASAQLPGPPAPASGTGLPVVDVTVPAARETEPVVLTGAQLPGWAVPSNQTFQPPLADFGECPPSFTPPSEAPDPSEEGASQLTEGFSAANCPEGYDPHNHYAEPLVDTGSAQPAGEDIGRMLGYRYDAKAQRFVQIPFQVDEQFTRYLDNTASGFAIYSGQDQHTTYAFDGPGDREGFRFTKDGPQDDPCRAQPASEAQGDPVRGLDANDELAFMAADGGPKAPADARTPRGIDGVFEIRLADPTNPSAPASFVYVMRATESGPTPAFDATNGYVRYERDPDAGLFAFSQSSYDNYGNAAAGLHCDAEGNVVRNADGTPKLARRRPRDGATITTDRYRYRYDGRWLMTDIRISDNGGETYGRDLVDRWKARAFAQDPGSETPCCGYEEEDTNWGGSSILLGERVGPVRAIRETWGADSGTNVIRRETFYREEVTQRTYLRVHVVPALDGIYAQWDFNAGAVDRFYNTRQTAGVPIDGRNDELFGNFDDPCNSNYDANDTGDIDQGYRTLYRQLQFCRAPYHFSADPGDPTFADANAALGWSVTAGPTGSIVDRISASVRELTPGGLAQSALAVPYYRDDACFDDGTGSDPGPKIRLRSADEPRVRADGVTPRTCWKAQDGDPDGSDKHFQGSIGTHGLHILMVAESDNARLTVPVNEITADWRMVMLPGRQDASAGERYGRGFEKPIVPIAVPATFEEEAAPPPPGGGNGNPGNGAGNGNGGNGNPGNGTPGSPGNGNPGNGKPSGGNGSPGNGSAGGGNGGGNANPGNGQGNGTGTGAGAAPAPAPAADPAPTPAAGTRSTTGPGLVLGVRQGQRLRTALRTSCSVPGETLRSCSVTLTDTGGRVLGQASATTKDGAPRLAVPVRLTAQGARILQRRRGTVRLTLRARAVDVDGTARRATSAVRVRTR